MGPFSGRTISGRTKALLADFLDAALTRSEIKQVALKADVPEEALSRAQGNKKEAVLTIVTLVQELKPSSAQEIILNLFKITADEYHGAERAEAQYKLLHEALTSAGLLKQGQSPHNSNKDEKPTFNPFNFEPSSPELPPFPIEGQQRGFEGASPITMTPAFMAKSQGSQPDPRKVFVIHGRNEAARKAMFAFLRSLHLEPIEWSEARSLTGHASPYIGDILDAAFMHATAVVALLTGDDEARLRPQFLGPGEKEEPLTPQARPNVLFEAGMAMGRNPQRTVFVELGQLRGFSDMAGRHAVRLTNNPKHRQELAQRLLDAGCTVNMKGTDWHDSGDFDNTLIKSV
jgi:predicted nucleotide-binding protein